MNDIESRFNEASSALGFLEFIGLLFLVLIVSETLWDVLTGKRVRWKESGANFTIFLISAILERTAYGLVFIVALALVEPFSFFTIPQTWWSWALALVAADFTYYWMHRFEHQIRILWAYHSVHHSSPEYNLTTAMRLAWVEALFEWVFLIPMLLIGFDLVQTIIAFLSVVSYQTWIHTEKINRLGWLDRIFNTPSVHRVHHGTNAQYIDKNYGGILIIWDRLFGTFEPEGEKVVYGITTPLGTSNPLTINFHEYGQIFKDAWQAKSLRNALGHLFKRPGWQPRTICKNDTGRMNDTGP